MSAKDAAKHFKMLNGQTTFFSSRVALPPTPSRASTAPSNPQPQWSEYLQNSNRRMHPLFTTSSANSFGSDASTMLGVGSLEDALSEYYLSQLPSPHSRHTDFTRDFTAMYTDASLESLKRRKEQLETNLSKRKEDEIRREGIRKKQEAEQESLRKARNEKREQRRLEGVRRNAAAINIERVARGFLGRSERIARDHEAALTIQQKFRRFMQILHARKELAARKAARIKNAKAARIQKHYRQFLDCREAKLEKERLRLAKHKQEQDAAIQQQNEAILEIQRVFRGAVARRQAKSLSMDRERKREDRKKENSKSADANTGKKGKSPSRMNRLQRAQSVKLDVKEQKRTSGGAVHPATKTYPNRLASKKSLVLTEADSDKAVPEIPSARNRTGSNTGVAGGRSTPLGNGSKSSGSRGGQKHNTHNTGGKDSPGPSHPRDKGHPNISSGGAFSGDSPKKIATESEMATDESSLREKATKDKFADDQKIRSHQFAPHLASESDIDRTLAEIEVYDNVELLHDAEKDNHDESEEEGDEEAY